MSIYQYWDKYKLPILKQKTFYVLAESTHKNKLLGILDFYEEPYVSLWETEDRPHLALYAPYLIPVKEGSFFDRWLIENEDSVPHTIINSLFSLDELKTHLKHFTMFDDQDADRRLFFRIGNASMFHLYIKSIEDNYQDLGKIFAHGFIDGYLFKDTSRNLIQYCDVAAKEGLNISTDKSLYLLWRNLDKEDINVK